MPQNKDGLRLFPEEVIAFDASNKSIDNRHDGDASTSTFGDDNSSHQQRHSSYNPEAPFMSKLDQKLLMSAYESESSSESSYWSNSSDTEEDDSSEEESDDDEEDEDGGYSSGGGVDSEGHAGTDNDDDHQHQNNVKAARHRPKRSDSALSLDALLKVSLQLGDAKKPPPKDRETRRRGRRLNRDHTPTSLGALARKVGSSTDNELKTSISGFRRCESANDLPTKPKKFLHVQQEGSPQAMTTTTAAAAHPTTPMHESHHGGATAPAAGGYIGLRRSVLAKYGEHATNVVKPRDHYLSLLHQAGIQAPLIPYSRLPHFFVPNTPEDRAAFDMDLVQTIRNQNLDRLQELQAAGHRMSARARFGESIIHICARRGTPEMLRYLLEEANVSPRVCCDYGRTPLHDAAWSTDAKSLKMMQILISVCPDLLLILDKRGFMPLDYIPKDRWPHCCAFLDKYKDILLPTGVLFGDDDDDDDSEDDDSEEDSGSEGDDSDAAGDSDSGADF